MSKRRISHQQARRIQSRQHDKSLSQPNGLCISRLGTQADIEDSNSKLHRCHIRQHLNDLVTGDQVIWQSDDAGVAVIEAICPRSSVLHRVDKHDKLKPIAANLNHMVIVTAPNPQPNQLLLDSYLVAAEALEIKTSIVLNKIDLPESARIHEEILNYYDQLGYPVLSISVHKNQGFEQLWQHLQHHQSIVVGQSGVGKSSLIAKLLPNEEIRIGELTQNERHGGHTTSASRLYHLPHGGNLIDSPGIREFKLWPMSNQEVARAFKELQPLIGRCKYRNCQHAKEPGCAFQQAVGDGTISPKRWTSYLKLAL